MAAFSTDSGDTSWVFPVLFFSYFIAPYILLQSYIIFIKKTRHTFSNKPMFTLTEKIIIPLIILVTVFSVIVNPTFENRKSEKEYQQTVEISSYIGFGYLFYSDPSLLSKGEEGLNSVIDDENLKFKNGISKNEYSLKFSEDKKSFTVLVESPKSNKEGIKVSIDDNNNIKYDEVTDIGDLYISPDYLFGYVSFQVADKEEADCSKENSNYYSPLTDFSFEETDDGISIKKYLGVENAVHIPCYVNGKPVVKIGKYAFNSKEINAVYMASTVKVIEEMAFANNEIDDIILYDNLTHIGKAAFMNNNLRSVLIPSSVKEVGSFAFYNNEINDLFFNNGVEKIADHTFQYNDIRNIIFPHSLKEVGEESFDHNKIESVYMFENVSSIKDKTLFDSSIKVEIKNNNPYYTSKNAVLEEK